MFSRRISARYNRGRVPPFGGLPIGFSLVTSVPCLQWVQGDLGVDVEGGLVTRWADQQSGAWHYTQGSGTQQPIYEATSFGGRPGLLFDGVDDCMNSALALDAASSTPKFIWALISQITWVANHYLFACSPSTRNGIFQGPTTPSLQIQNGITGSFSNGATLGTMARVEAFYNNNTTDFIKAAGVNASGINAFTGAATTSTTIGAQSSAGTVAVNFRIGALGVFAALPTVPERNALSAWAQAYGGPTVGI